MIRRVLPHDTAALSALIDATSLFPGYMLNDMLSEYFDRHIELGHVWLTDDLDGNLVGIAYYAPERMTAGTWNLYLIAIHPDRQREGRGYNLLSFIEHDLAASEQRMLLIETSGLTAFEPTWMFYRKCGYQQEARIRDFYEAGEDKLVFRKVLTT